MCVPYWKRDPKTRRWMAIANISLVLGLLLWNFRSYIPIERGWLDGVCGLLMGLSISLNLSTLVFARRCASAAQDKL